MTKATDNKNTKPKPLTQEELAEQMAKSNDSDVKEEAARHGKEPKEAKGNSSAGRSRGG